MNIDGMVMMFRLRFGNWFVRVFSRLNRKVVLSVFYGCYLVKISVVSVI